MENPNDDDIDVLSNGDNLDNVVEVVDSLIDIHNPQRQQLYFSNAGNTEDNAASLHSLKVSYDALKRRYNELEIKTQTMQKVITEMETDRLGKDRMNPRFGGASFDAAGSAASGGSPDMGSSSDGSTANVRAHLGYAQRLERQIVRLQLSMEEQTQKFRKAMEIKHSENDQLKSLLMQKEGEIQRLKERNLETRGSSDFSNVQLLQKQVNELREENIKLHKEVKNQEDHIQALVQRNQLGHSKLTSSLGTYGENESILMLDNGKILQRIRDQNQTIQSLKQQMEEQRQMIEDQTKMVHKVIESAQGSGHSSIISRLIEGSSIHQQFNESRTSDPRSHRSPKSSFAGPRDSGIGQLTSSFQTVSPSQLNKPLLNQKVTTSSGVVRDGSMQYFQTVQIDHHDGLHESPQLSPMAKIQPQAGLSNVPRFQTQAGPNNVSDQTGARPKVGSTAFATKFNFSPLEDDFSMNQPQQLKDDKRYGKGNNSDLNVNYVPLQTINSPTGDRNSPQNVHNNTDMFAPNILRQGEINLKQPQQNTEIVSSGNPRREGLDRRQSQQNMDNIYAGNFQQHSPDIGSSSKLFGSNGGEKFIGRTSKQPQQNEDLHTVTDPIVENDYVNVWGDRANNRPINQETASPGNLSNQINRCPVCSQEFPTLGMEDFQMHVLHCIDDSNDDQLQTLQNPADTSNNRICPMCDAAFPAELPQEEFERHVQEHFGEDPIADRFEVLNT